MNMEDMLDEFEYFDCSKYKNCKGCPLYMNQEVEVEGLSEKREKTRCIRELIYAVRSYEE